MKRRVALVLLALAAPAAAHEPRYSATFDRCTEHSDGVTAAMLDCIGDEHGRQDTRLNAAYRDALAALPASRRAALTGAQRAWLAWRDADCAFELDPDGGSIARIVAADCVLRHTAERADALEAIAREAADR